MKTNSTTRDSAANSAAFLRHADAAMFLGISRRQLARLTARRVVAVSRFGRKLVLYGRGDLEQAVERFRRSAIGEVIP